MKIDRSFNREEEQEDRGREDSGAEVMRETGSLPQASPSPSTVETVPLELKSLKIII